MPRLDRAVAALLALMLAAPGAVAHPHIFIDGGVDFLFDAEGRLERLRVIWIYDPLTSLFMLEELGIDPAAEDLAAGERARLAAYQTEWQEGFEGDSYLRHGGRRVGLSGPLAPQAALTDGRVQLVFERALAAPFRPGADTVAEIYDPSYYSAYSVTHTPRLEGEAVGCRAEVLPFDPTDDLRTLQEELAAIPADGDPAQPVGALFADRVRLQCD